MSELTSYRKRRGGVITDVALEELAHRLRPDVFSVIAITADVVKDPSTTFTERGISVLLNAEPEVRVDFALTSHDDISRTTTLTGTTLYLRNITIPQNFPEAAALIHKLAKALQNADYRPSISVLSH